MLQTNFAEHLFHVLRWIRLAPINAPASQDLTMCGAGMDIAYVDRADLVVGCERVLLRKPTCAEEKQIQADREVF